MTSKTYSPVHGGYPGTVPTPDPALRLRSPSGGYTARSLGSIFDDVPAGPYVVATDSESWLQHLAEVWPNRIFFVTEEAFA